MLWFLSNTMFIVCITCVEHLRGLASINYILRKTLCKFYRSLFIKLVREDKNLLLRN